MFFLLNEKLCLISLAGAQMVMTDVSDSKERAATLGRLGVSYGVGMIVGPIMGGYVTKVTSEQSAAAVAAGICLVAIAIVMVFVPRTTKRVTAKEESSKESKAQGEGACVCVCVCV